MTTGNDDAVRAREDSFLGTLIPQVTEHLRAQQAGEFDVEAGRARFVSWLAAHTKEKVPAAAAKGRAGAGYVAGRPSARTLAPPAGGQVCALFAVDIAGFTAANRDDDIRLYMHEVLYRVLQKAFDGSGIPWADCFREDRGDGLLIVVPPAVPIKGLIDPLPERLRALIRWHNHVSRDAAGIQLRAAAHIGPVEYDGHGFVGTDINLLFRMLEARPLKTALAGSGAELALIVSDYVYTNLVRRYPSLVTPDAFRPVKFQIKNNRVRAWTYLPGLSIATNDGGAGLT
jgi:class 3 adenylate cyclase